MGWGKESSSALNLNFFWFCWFVPMLPAMLSVSYIVQYRKYETEIQQQASKSSVWMWPFPCVNHSLQEAVVLLDLWRYFMDVISAAFLAQNCLWQVLSWILRLRRNNRSVAWRSAKLQAWACFEESPVYHLMLCLFPVVHLPCNSQRAEPRAVCLTLVSRPLSRLNQEEGISLKL